MSGHRARQTRAGYGSPFAEGPTDWAEWDDWAEPGDACAPTPPAPAANDADANAAAANDADADPANPIPGTADRPGTAHPATDADPANPTPGAPRTADPSGAAHHAAYADRLDPADAHPRATGTGAIGARAGTPHTPDPHAAGTPLAPDECADAVALVGSPERHAAHAAHHPGTAWADAWQAAWSAGRPGAPVARPLGETLGCALAEPLAALTDLPAFDSSAMDGWAVAGPGPWRLTGQVLAGGSPGAALADGEAVRIATGAPLPGGATAVLRREGGATREAVLYATGGAPGPGQDVRPRGQECRRGDALVAAGRVVTPAVLGLAAAAGYDRLAVVPRPRVELLVLGDELLESGLPGDGRVRDALGPMLPGWLRALGADVTAVRRLVDDAAALRDALTATAADVVLTTGGTAGGPVDHVHPVLAELGARLLVDGVAVRPGHPMLLARLPGGAHLVGLPGNPLAAVSGVLTLAAPLIGAVAGRPAPVPYRAPLTEAVTGHPAATRLVPVAYDDESRAVPLPFSGPAMLRGLAIADGLAVVPPGGLPRGAEATVLDTTWTPPAASAP